MFTFERFESLFRRELARIPEKYKRGVNQFFLEKKACRHPGSFLGLYVLGHYHSFHSNVGPAVTLYYGSFRKVFRRINERALRLQIAKTIAHELLHHWEWQSGIDPLGEEDRRKLVRWKQKLGHPTGEPTGRDLIEALFFLFIVLIGIAAAARMIG